MHSPTFLHSPISFYLNVFIHKQCVISSETPVLGPQDILISNILIRTYLYLSVCGKLWIGFKIPHFIILKKKPATTCKKCQHCDKFLGSIVKINRGTYVIISRERENPCIDREYKNSSIFDEND